MRLHEINMRKIEIARRIWTKTSNVIRSGTKGAYYFEGSRRLPLIAFAKNTGFELVSLDENNEHYTALVRAIRSQGYMGGMLRNEQDALQMPREEEWVRRITKPGLLVAGAEHLRNTWGLVSKLGEKSIEVEIILDHKQDSEANDALKRESDDIIFAAFERWQNS